MKDDIQRERIAREESERVETLAEAASIYRSAATLFQSRTRVYMDAEVHDGELRRVGEGLDALASAEAALLQAYSRYLATAPPTHRREDAAAAPSALGAREAGVRGPRPAVARLLASRGLLLE